MRITQRVIVNPEIGKVRDLVVLTEADMRPMVDRTDRVFRENERQLFQSQGASGGPRWANLSAAYAKTKRPRGPVLVRTGSLRRAATTRSDAGHVARSSLNPARIELGMKGEAARIGGYHHDGNARLPRRDPIQMVQAQESRLHAEVRAVLLSKLKGVVDAIARGARRARL